MRPVQRFSAEYLERVRKTTPNQIVRFLDEFRQIHASRRPSRLISMRVPEPLLASFKERCRMEGIPYQARIKELMAGWLGSRPL